MVQIQECALRSFQNDVFARLQRLVNDVLGGPDERRESLRPQPALIENLFRREGRSTIDLFDDGVLVLEELCQREAFGRAAEPWEIANVIVFLASDLSTYMTGEIVSVSSQRA